MIAKTQLDFHGTIGTSDPKVMEKELAEKLFELELIFNGQGHPYRIHVFGGKQVKQINQVEQILELLKGRFDGATILLKNAKSESLKSLLNARLQEAESILLGVEELLGE